jgi:hypothetical protein
VVKKVKVFGSGSEVANSNISIFNSYQTNPSTITNIGSFLINTNNSSRVINNTKKLTNFSSNITIDSLKLNQDQITSIINKTTHYSFNIDKTNLLSYAKYGSLFERFKAAVNNIITTFPGSLYVNGLIDDFTSYNTVNNYVYDSTTNIGSFNVNMLSVKNKFNLNINNSSLNNDPSNHELKNLPVSYSDYVLFVNNTEYDVLGFTGLTSTNNTTLYFKVKGNPFTGSTSSLSYHIKPNQNKYTLFYSNLDFFEQYLLNKDITPIYTVNFRIPILDEDNDTIIYNNKTLTWTTTDGYNIDIDNISFENYYSDFIEICNIFDLVKSDLINRMLMTQSVIITDNSESNKSVQISRILGREIDEIKRYVDGLQFVNTLSYDKIDNTSDVLIKSMANTLGFQHFNFVELDNVFESMFTPSVANVTGSTNNGKTPSELDIELWRNILINTNYLFKSKGTRKGIEGIFSILGLPDAFIEINEHVYTVDGVIDPNNVDLTVIYPLNETLTTLPYDNNGYPVAGNEIDSYWFQMNGNEDRGQAYLDVYRKLGFNITKQIDNKKSWVYSTGQTRHTDSFSPTAVDYLINESKLVLNTKEISVYLDPIQAIENDVYNYNKTYNFPISSTGRTYPYPNRSNTSFSVTGLTFNQYVSESYINFINVQNRKTITSANGINYPSLYKLYEDYLLVTNSNKYTLEKIYTFIDKFQNLYQKLITQLLSATVIVGEDGIKIKNLIYTEQKFDYKNGIDVGSEFKNEQPKDLNADLNSVTTISGFYTKPITNNTYLFQSYGNGSYNGSNSSNGVINSNTNNLSGFIKPHQHFSSFIVDLDIPTLDISGATKIGSIGTNNSVYYYDNSTGHTLQYTVTDNLPVLQNSGNTFNYEIYSLDKTITGFTNLEIVVNTDYKSFTGSSVFTDTLEKTLLSGDTEYIIKPYFEYRTNLLTGETINFSSVLDSYNLDSILKYPLQKAYYNYYFDNSKYYSYTGQTYSTKSNGVYDLPYYNYNNDSDWYFLSVKNPDKPVILTTSTSDTTQQPLGNLYTENIVPDNTDTFVLSYQPAGDIKVSVNGSTLQKNTEYSGVTSLPAALANITFKLLVPFNSSTDLLTVTYVINSAKNSLITENEFVNYMIPTGTTRGLDGRVFYDTTNNYYSYIMDINSFDGTSNNLLVTYNGNTLTPNQDYSLSNIVKNKIKLHNILVESGDTITVSYPTQNQSIISMSSTSQVINWDTNNVIPINETGYFNLELSTDTVFNTITCVSNNINYVVGQNVFSETIDLTIAPYNVLTYNTTYYGRIKSTRLYSTVNGDIIPVTIYSDKFTIKTTS